MIPPIISVTWQNTRKTKLTWTKYNFHRLSVCVSGLKNRLLSMERQTDLKSEYFVYINLYQAW